MAIDSYNNERSGILTFVMYPCNATTLPFKQCESIFSKTIYAFIMNNNDKSNPNVPEND